MEPHPSSTKPGCGDKVISKFQVSAINFLNFLQKNELLCVLDVTTSFQLTGLFSRHLQLYNIQRKKRKKKKSISEIDYIPEEN